MKKPIKFPMTVDEMKKSYTKDSVLVCHDTISRFHGRFHKRQIEAWSKEGCDLVTGLSNELIKSGKVKRTGQRCACAIVFSDKFNLLPALAPMTPDQSVDPYNFSNAFSKKISIL